MNDTPLSGFLLDTPGLFLTLGTEYSLKKSIYEDWKDVKKEIMNKIKLCPSMNVYLQQQDVSYGGERFQLLTWLHIPRLKIPWFVYCVLFGGDSFSRTATSDIVARTTSRIFVGIGSAAELEDMFCIQIK